MFSVILEYAKAEAEAGDWASVATILSTKSISITNPKMWKWSEIRKGILLNFSVDACNLVGSTLMELSKVDPDANAAWIALSTNGLSLHEPDRQSKIDQIGAFGKWDQALIDYVKSFGVAYVSPSGTTVTPEECESAWITGKLHEQFNELFNEHISPSLTMGTKTGLIQGLQSMIAALQSE